MHLGRYMEGDFEFPGHLLLDFLSIHLRKVKTIINPPPTVG